MFKNVSVTSDFSQSNHDLKKLVKEYRLSDQCEKRDKSIEEGDMNIFSNLLRHMLDLDVQRRWNVDECLNHDWFRK